ncbi:mitochondrial ribosomal protein S18 [Volvox carteri f. nagariensis]|uniref:Mitochondrial ribosomal protein S18 n=1 Tax=Volvox carteri f. nagariensis TaxID=3068 RepID=D8UAJ6_VOLCA|nr:mitochondrial ribosomal protein S18 [Volvox carteri f. nagariensis]EFJ43335.1 mitochondrial ribosomal protein S18 [Volvox carteri f. nagariensis]|eukprot:XP_002955695.1 mitochondrial ribosomal protein S18 [Volvox carteri f. nagariensis]
MSTSNPNKPDDHASQPSSSDSGPDPARPTFTARLRDLLAVSNWRISKGERGRLANVKEDLAAASTAGGLPHLPPGQAAADAAAEAAAAALQASTSTTTSTDTSGGGDGVAPLQQQLPQAHQDEPQLELPPHQRLLHPKYGYAVLGGAVPADEGATTAAGLVGMLTSQQPRVNPRRRFLPGETYEAQDLNPYTARTWGRVRTDAGAVRRPTVAEVMEKADYKNVAFLTRWFLSPGGRLLSRRHTRLPVAVHK